jgi:hypothetical protein
VALMRVADERPWSGKGRPAWVSDRGHDIDRIFAIIFGVESPGVFRCLAIVFMKGGDGWNFPLDVSFEDFAALPDVSVSELARTAQEMLYRLPMLSLDPDQEAGWRRLERHPRPE